VIASTRDACLLLPIYGAAFQSQRDWQGLIQCKSPSLASIHLSQRFQFKEQDPAE
jgi:hypothetical protein